MVSTEETLSPASFNRNCGFVSLQHSPTIQIEQHKQRDIGYCFLASTQRAPVQPESAETHPEKHRQGCMGVGRARNRQSSWSIFAPCWSISQRTNEVYGIVPFS